MLQITVIGNLTKNAEVKEVGGKSYNSFDVAVNEGKDAQGNERTTFVQVMKPVYQDNKVFQYLTKGTKVMIQGRLSVKAWQANDNSLRADITCWADDLELLSATQQQAAPAPAPAPAAPAPAPAPAPAAPAPQPGYQQMPPQQQQYAAAPGYAPAPGYAAPQYPQQPQYPQGGFVPGSQQGPGI